MGGKHGSHINQVKVPRYRPRGMCDEMVMIKLVFFAGFAASLLLGALSHPLIYRAVFGGPRRSADHDRIA